MGGELQGKTNDTIFAPIMLGRMPGNGLASAALPNNQGCMLNLSKPMAA